MARGVAGSPQGDVVAARLGTAWSTMRDRMPRYDINRPGRADHRRRPRDRARDRPRRSQPAAPGWRSSTWTPTSWTAPPRSWAPTRSRSPPTSPTQQRSGGRDPRRGAFGGVDLLIANAGIAPMPATARTMDPAEFERVVEVNLLGVYRTVRAGPRARDRAPWPGGPGLERVRVPQRHGPDPVRGRQGRRRSSWGGRCGSSSRPRGVGTVAYFGFVDTRMVQRIVDDTSAEQRDELLPAFIRRRITPGGRRGGGRTGDRAPAGPGGRASLLGRAIDAPRASSTPRSTTCRRTTSA